MPDDVPSSSLPERHAPSFVEPGQRTTFEIAFDSAKRVLQRRFRVLLLIRDAYTRLSRHNTALKNARDDLAIVLRLMKAWALQTYDHIPWGALLLMASAVVYFVAPVDLIPDAIVGIGFVDDLAVVSAVVRTVREELDRFRQWEHRQLTEGTAPTNGSLPPS